MGLIQKYKQFKEHQREKALARNGKLIRNPKAIREDRVAAIDFFKAQPEAEKAVPALLARFDYSLEHGINDTREKESAMEGILAFKDAALPHIETHLRESDRIAWPIKAYKALANDSQMIATLASCLDFGDTAFDQKKIDKNYDILCYLRDFKLPSPLAQKCVQFLTAYDERLRFVAVEVLLEQNDPALAGHLEPLLFDSSAENTRIRQTVVHGFLKYGWTLTSSEQCKPGPFLPGLRISNDYRLEKVASFESSSGQGATFY